jgi:eukaryotic-like serine/threonine-protein kinase
MELTPGDKLGPYEIVSALGKGGMGQVYRARDTRLGREVAIKVLLDRKGGGSSHRRFFREARAASALNHANIVAVYDIGSAKNGSPYIVMELVAGESLRARLLQGPFTVPLALAVASQIVDGLECAHKAGCVHRDLKPENIMLTGDDRVKILDFGLAKAAPVLESEESQTMLTMAGMVVGTPAYMSPEQARGQALGPASDQFSVGVIVYEMLCGVQPFRRGSVAETLAAVITSEPVALSAWVPPRLSAIVARTLSKDPLLRYPSCLQLKAALEGVSASTTAGSGIRTITATLPAANNLSTGTIRSLTVQATPAIAVLPFTDLSPEQDQAYFCEGIAEDTISALSRVPGLRVVSRGSSFRFHGGEYDLREIAEKLNVNSVLEGRVRKMGNRLRITAQLVNVESGFSIWSERYDGLMRDVFDIQDEISSAIVSSLKLKLAEQKKDQVAGRYTENLEAYHAYLKGRYAWNKRTPAGLRAAMEHFEQALAVDPQYALAWTGVADCCIVPTYYGYADPRQLMPRGKAAALRALEIDPDLAEGHATLGMITGLYEHEWQKAEACFQRALEINPNYAIARMWYACFNLAPMGRLEEAAREARRARDIDPINQSVCAVVGMIDYWNRQFDQAIPEMSNVLEIDPNFPIAHIYLGLALHASGRRKEAFEHCRKAIAAMDNSPMGVSVLGHFYGVAGETANGSAVLDDLKQLAGTRYVSACWAALVHIGLGDLDAAFAALGRGIEVHASELAWIAIDPIYDGLRTDKRYPDLLQRMGLANQISLVKSAL